MDGKGRYVADTLLAFIQVGLLLAVALVGFCWLPFYSLWTWCIGDPWWKSHADRPPSGFWNTRNHDSRTGKGGYWDHP